MSAIQAKWGYRSLLQTAKKVFKQDTYAIEMARLEVRKHYHENKNEMDDEKRKEMILGIDQVVSMMSENIVQGVANEEGRYQVALGKKHENSNIEPVDQHKVPDTVVVSSSKDDCGCH